MPTPINLAWQTAGVAMKRLVERLAACEPTDGWYSARQLPMLNQADYVTILRASPEALGEVQLPLSLVAEALVSPDSPSAGRLVRALGQALEPVLRHKLLAALIDHADALAPAVRWVPDASLRNASRP